MARRYDLQLRIGGDDQGAQRALRNVNGALDRTQRQSRITQTAVASLSRAFGALAAAASVGAIASFAQDSLRAARDIDEMSRAIGISAERYQELTYAFGQFRLQSDDVSDALGTLADRARDAIDGAQSMADDFGLVGIAVDDLRGKSPAELFDLFANAIARTEDPIARTAAAVRTFGDDLGRQLIPLLQRGEAGLQEMGDAAVVMGDEAVAAAAEVSREYDALVTHLVTRFQSSSSRAAALRALAT